MKKLDDIKLSKFLSLILRHKPETIGITLDKNGWVDINELIEKIKLSNRYIDMEIARNVGRRHGEVIILPIDIEGLKKIGHKFYLSENNVWLSDDIPSKYILWEKINK